MSRVAIVTDSVANLPPEVAADHNIRVVPLRIMWQGETFRDGVDISHEEFYARLRTDHCLPTTSTFTPGELLEDLHIMMGEADAVVGIFLAHELSGTFEAAQMVQRLDPALPFRVVDSRTAAMAEGFVALEAARAAEAGATVDGVIARAQELIPRVHLLATLETLDYLRRGGRIGGAAAFLGSMLQMKPIIGIAPGQGAVAGYARPRTWKHAIENMLDLMAREVGDRPVHAAVGYGGHDSDARALAEVLRQRFDIRELYMTYFTPVMGAHAGPVLSVSFYADDATSIQEGSEETDEHTG